MSHILLLPFGTSGSVFPFIWLGKKLLDRGHRVTMITSSMYERVARAAGIHIVCPTPDELPLMLAQADLWKPRRCKQVAFVYAARAVAPCAAAIDQVVSECGKPDLMLAPMISFAARIAREKYVIPLVTVHLYPAAMMSGDDVPLVFPEIRFVRLLPLVLRKFIISLPSPYDRYALPLVIESCVVHGVCPPRRLWKDWHHSPDGVLALFPSWFSRVERDRPHNTLQWDFPLEDLANQHEIEATLESFITAGEKPILFTAGTGQFHATRFFEVAAQVVVKLGYRAVFLTAKVDQVPKNLSNQIFVTAYAPFSLILPRASVMVHHGGIGTSSQCLAAGIPQLVVHMTLDQPDNAARIERLGVGLCLGIKQLNEKNLESLLKRCLTDKKISRRATLRAQDMQRNKPVAELLDWIEKVI